MNIKEKVLTNETNLTNLLSERKVKEGRFILYVDNKLKEMWDHNFFELLTDLDDELFEELRTEKKNQGFEHLKVQSRIELPYLDKKGFGSATIIAMVKEDINLEVPNKEVTFKNIQNDDIGDAIIDIELRHYGEQYGKDFTIKKMKRYFDACKENKGLNFFAAYLGDKLVCYCHTFFDNDVVAIDGLLTDIDYRNRKIATSILGYVQHYYNCPVYLHADTSETAKDIYNALGFKEVACAYEYLTLSY